MKVDMSPEAISGRLEAMGQLWELSVELMRSKPAKERSEMRSRGLEIQDSIRKVLTQNWDPLGVAKECTEEYDAYIAPVYRILVGTRSPGELVECLRRIEKDQIGTQHDNPEALATVAEKLLDLDVSINRYI